MAQQPKFWQKKSLAAYALWPLSLLYSAVSRAHLFCRGRKAYKASIPVISVGNIHVGGVGKTPVVAHLAEHFAGEGHRVAILSRGYGGKHKRPYKVTAQDNAQDVGDEPAMLFQQFLGKSIDIWVSPNRIASAKRAEISGATMIILDDGFQYVGLTRDVNLVVLDGTYAGKLNLGNAFTLPAGPLREAPHALRRADALIVLNAAEATSDKRLPMPMFNLTTRLDKNVVNKLQSDKEAHNVMTAIGRPEKFVEALKLENININNVFAHSDHHYFTQADMESATQDAKTSTLITSKDAVKIPEKWRHKFTTVPLHLAGEGLAELTQWLHTRLK